MAIAAEMAALTREQMLEMFRSMAQIRAFENRAYELYREGVMRGTNHAYVGEEAIAVGVCAALKEDDTITSTHRGHGHCIAKGGDVSMMMAELLGKETGYCRGKGGSLHIADASVGMLGANGIVGAGYAIAAGAALSAKANRTGRVAVVFFGDGAVTRGTFHEVMNMASLWKLPLLLVCENNGLAQYVHTAETMVFDSVASLAAGYRMPGVTIDGNDVSAVYRATGRAAARARGGEGPTLLELKTQRFMGHSSGDPQVYRTKEQVQALRQSRDPIARLEAELKAEGLLGDRAARFAEIEAEVAAAVRFAESSPYPPAGALFEDVYA